MKRLFLGISTLLFFLSELLVAEVNLIPLKDNKNKDSEYSSILCFRISETSKSLVFNQKGRHDVKGFHFLRYFNGPSVSQVAIEFHGYSEGYDTYFNDMVYLAAKPGKYDLLDFFDPGLGDLSFPINTVIELKAGQAYYAGEVAFNLVYTTDEFKRTYSLFKQNIISDTIIHNFEKKYPDTFKSFKDDFVAATFSSPTPLQPTKVIFSSHFAKSEGLWHESNDSLHTASYENGKYCIEGKPVYNLGAETIELPEKFGNTFDIELRCTWKTGFNTYPYGLIIPGHHFLDPKCPEGEVEPRGYIFGLSSGGFACIWYEGLYIKRGHEVLKTRVGLTNWKNIPKIKTNGSGENIIRIQVIDKVMTYYINDVFVSRAPQNSFPGLNKYLDFLNTGSNTLGIFSLNKQKIEFDEIKVSKFD
jgi:hypothetical protein